MSFALTKDQIRERTKFVTRRMGWMYLKPQERFAPVEKCQGLKKGERQVVIVPRGGAPELECVTNTQQRLGDISAHDVVREGFPNMTPVEFVAMFCRTHRDADKKPVTAYHVVTRIRFRYVATDCRCFYVAPEQRANGVMCSPCFGLNARISALEE